MVLVNSIVDIIQNTVAHNLLVTPVGIIQDIPTSNGNLSGVRIAVGTVFSIMVYSLTDSRSSKHQVIISAA